MNYKLLSVGDRAPEFAATASNGRQIRLSEQLERGHVVLIFYPGNNTPG